MPYRTPTNWITLALAIAAVVVSAFGLFTYQNTVTVRHGEKTVTQSYAVREATYKLRSSIKDMETGQRGFLITGDKNYLKPYEVALETVEEEFEILRTLTRDNAEQIRRLNELQSLFQEKRSELEETIKLRIASPGAAIPDDALEITVSGRGNRVMDDMRTLFTEILDTEKRLLDSREKDAASAATASERYIVAGNLLALTLFLLTGIVAHFERKKRGAAEAHMRSSQSKIREQVEILNQVRDAILVCDMNDRIIFWNRGARQLYGISDEQAIGRNVADVLFRNHREWWDQGVRSLMEQGVCSSELHEPGEDGHEKFIEQRRSLIRGDDGQPVAQLIINFDITDRKREEAKQRRSQRLESIGTLAGGIAHDLNNVLTPILMSAKLLTRGDNHRQRLAETIVAGAERGAQMIKKLLAFAGGEAGIRQRFDVREVLLEAEEILRHTLPKTIDLQVSCDDNLYAVSGDATELSQVLMNLAINARDAMPDGGRLEIRAENFFVDAARAKRSDTLQPGPHVLLTVADTGTGIESEIIERIFDPFFTTKQQGKGTGLGLATTLGIVRANHGDITVYSEPGRGTSFTIYLPSAKPEDLSDNKFPEAELPAGGSETILLVDDEHLILESARAALEAAGYRVATAGDGAEALAVFQQEGGAIDLVLVDMMMPGMDGLATKNGLRARKPGLRVIASSGLRRPGADGGSLADFDGFLAKPYSDDQLLRLVRGVLDQKTHQESS